MKDYFSLQELYDYFIKISNLKYEGHYSVMDYPLQELLELLQKEFINDDENVVKLQNRMDIQWYFRLGYNEMYSKRNKKKSYFLC